VDDGGGEGGGKASRGSRMIQDGREVGIVGDGVAGGVRHDKTEAAKSPEVRLCITSDHGARGREAYRRRRQRKLVSPHGRVSSRRVVAGNRLGAVCGRASLPRSICGCEARAAGVVVDGTDLPVFQILGHPTSPNSTMYLGPECQSAICCSGVIGSRDPAGLLAELRNMHVLHVVS